MFIKTNHHSLQSANQFLSVSRDLSWKNIAHKRAYDSKAENNACNVCRLVYFRVAMVRLWVSITDIKRQSGYPNTISGV